MMYIGLIERIFFLLDQLDYSAVYVVFLFHKFCAFCFFHELLMRQI